MEFRGECVKKADIRTTVDKVKAPAEWSIVAKPPPQIHQPAIAEPALADSPVTAKAVCCVPTNPIHTKPLELNFLIPYGSDVWHGDADGVQRVAEPERCGV